MLVLRDPQKEWAVSHPGPCASQGQQEGFGKVENENLQVLEGKNLQTHFSDVKTETFSVTCPPHLTCNILCTYTYICALLKGGNYM